MEPRVILHRTAPSRANLFRLHESDTHSPRPLRQLNQTECYGTKGNTMNAHAKPKNRELSVIHQAREQLIARNENATKCTNDLSSTCIYKL